jgi:hypothetical protein
MDSGWRSNNPSSNVGESAALSITSARRQPFLGLYSKSRQRPLRQIHMAISSAQPRTAATNTDTMNSKGKKNQLQKWRRGWDSNPRYGFPYARFRGEYFQPLSHLSAVVADLIVAERRVFRQSGVRELTFCQCAGWHGPESVQCHRTEGHGENCERHLARGCATRGAQRRKTG